ncbi:MAG: type II toxin-antitoxin system RelE/ParE family toxin [Lachnospiraceae bacterium]|nr:type II toxin-antitoxin system RelE/ParE family toxin [Lachnospiraceae bacterium]
MKEYKVTITPEALEDLNRYLSYLLFVKKSEQAYNAVLEDYYDTIDELSRVAGSLHLSSDPELSRRGLKEMFFIRHRYVMLYYIGGDEAVVVYIFHTLEDYRNKL